MGRALLAILLLLLSLGAQAQPPQADDSGNYWKSYAFWEVWDRTPLNGRAQPDPDARILVRFPRAYLLEGRGLVKDRRGLPWLKVEFSPGETCFVRAHRDYVAPAHGEPVQPDSRGDYGLRMLHAFWKVVDPDPGGLNVRLHPQFPEKYEDARLPWPAGDVRDWPVVHRFPPGSILKAVQGNVGMITLKDSDGKFWLMVQIPGGVGFVRSNRDFIQPVPGPLERL